MGDGDDKPQPTEMDKLLADLAQLGLTVNGKPVAADTVATVIVNLIVENGELKTTIKVLRKM